EAPDFSGGDPIAPAVDSWELDDTFNTTEDVTINLGALIDAGIDSSNANASDTFAVTISNLQPGAQVTGMTETDVSGTLWFRSGSGSTAALRSVLDSINVSPPDDWNDNHGPFTF